MRLLLILITIICWYKNRFIQLQYKSIDWFLYEWKIGLKWVNFHLQCHLWVCTYLLCCWYKLDAQNSFWLITVSKIYIIHINIYIYIRIHLSFSRQGVSFYKVLGKIFQLLGYSIMPWVIKFDRLRSIAPNRR